MTLRWRVVGSAAVVGSLSSLLLGHTVAPLMLIGTVPPLGVRWLQTSPTYLRSSPFILLHLFSNAFEQCAYHLDNITKRRQCAKGLDTVTRR